MNKTQFNKRMKFMFLVSPLIFFISIWLVYEIFDPTLEGKIIVGVITVFGGYAALIWGVKEYHSKKLK